MLFALALRFDILLKENGNFQVPAFALFMQNSSYDWRYHAEPGEFSGFGLNGGTFWPRGKVLGGSGAMNAMLYARGTDRDFDEWKSAGNPSWGWDDVLPYFVKSEKNNKSSEFHGTDGLLSIENYESSEVDIKMKDFIAESFAELGFAEIDDINSNEFLGFTHAQGTLESGSRHSTAKAFLNREITGQRQNLHVIKFAHVTKVNFDGLKRVSSVEFVRNEEDVQLSVRVKEEVILSAGAVNTPQILMLSGIGPDEDLKKLGIEAIEALNGVGGNLQDHLITPYILAFHKSSAAAASFAEIASEYFSYLTKRKGIFSNLGSTDLMAFMSTVNDPRYPDVQFLNFMFAKGSAATLHHLLNIFNYKQEIIDSIVSSNNEADVLMIFTVLLNPKSRGTIKLRSADPFDSPKIFANYLQEPEDVQTVSRAMKTLRKMPTTGTFKRHEGEVVRAKLSKCDGFAQESNEYWDCYIRSMSITLYHPVGTAKMGPSSDASAVVDDQLKVKGVVGLRVADASVMPNIVSANTNAAVIMIGERAADFIKQERGNAGKDEL